MDIGGCSALTVAFPVDVGACGCTGAFYAPDGCCAAREVVLLEDDALALNGTIGTIAGPSPVQSEELDVGTDTVAAIGPAENAPALKFEAELAIGTGLGKDATLLFPAERAGSLGAVVIGLLGEPDPKPNVAGGGGPIVVKFAQAIFVRFA